MSYSARRHFHVYLAFPHFFRRLIRNSYRFKADLYGTSWYHSHYSAQYAGGLLGPMIIHGPANYDYDLDLGPVFLSDCKSQQLQSYWFTYMK